MMQTKPRKRTTHSGAPHSANPRLRIVGHRGAAKLAAENSVASVMKALEYPVDEIEIDVRVTADGIVVVHHDAAIRDASGAEYTIARHDYRALLERKHDLATLDEVISAIDRRVPLQVEVKPHEAPGPVAAILQARLKAGWEPKDFLIGSRDQAILRTLHALMPTIPIVIIEPYLSIRAVLRARKLNTKRISMNRRGLWPGFIRSMQRRGYLLYAYTLDDKQLAHHWHTSGLSGVFTYDPGVYLTPLKPKRRG